jgi:ABC-type Na+ efflux pump permease subunit
MHRTEMIFQATWTALMGVLIVGGPEQPYREWTMPLGILMFLPSVFVVVAFTASAGAAGWQRIVKRIRETEPGPAASQ